MKVTKITEDYEVNVHVVLPTIKINEEIKKVDGTIQKVNIFSLPINFVLTSDKNYLKIEFSILIGLCLTIRIKEQV